MKNRKQKRRSNRSQYRPSHVFAACISVLVVLLLLRIEVQENNQDFSSTMRERQCEDSCYEAITAKYKRQNTTYQRPSSDLASSAVDAIVISTKKEQKNDRKDSEDKTKIGNDEERSGSVEEDDSSDSSEMVEEVNDRNLSRPLHLPPLIEKLVGKHSGDIDTTSEKMRNQSIRPAYSGEVSTSDSMIPSLERNKIRSLRMKTCNEEWENALRWISSWGKAKNSEESQQQNVSTSKSEKNGNVSGSTRKSNESMITSRQFNQLLQQCYSRCNKMPESTTKRTLFTSTSVSRMMSPVLSDGMIMHLLGAFISSAILLFSRQIMERIREHQSKSSIKSLLEEEQAATGTVRVKRQSERKRKRKKAHRGQLARSKNQALKDDNNSWSGNLDNNDSDIEDEEVYNILKGTSSYRINRHSIDMSSDQASKSTNSTASMNTNDSVQTELTLLKENKFNDDQHTERVISKDEKKKNIVYPSKKSLPIPTDTERINAAEKLREFQSIQLNKYIAAQKQKEKGKYSHKTTMKDSGMKVLHKPDSDNKVTPIPASSSLSPPPGFSLPPSTEESNIIHKSHLEYHQSSTTTHINIVNGSDIDSMLYQILDDSNDECIGLQPSKQRNVNIQDTKSIGLGNLLVPNSFYRSDPHDRKWDNFSNKPSVASTHNETTPQCRETDDSTDTAPTEFVPSWGGGANFNAKIW
ncbi:predicted protein [Chaetoceros tenuissimus]|uniref:Uncharacterized protein n=1 Tax=Chaetoceros tenuissimus TaxID=426638 RepID=A0AAD3DB67_9STRA|nr:predicted protein [Chaetoceros tenuissimus]